ncbi:MAG TPA: ABC transporter substrate-binding protein [Ideonella sp.]|nr:ABC transporter substrate-binding protein [Ideonella sp.]
MTLRSLVASFAAACCCLTAAAADAPPKVLKYAFPIAETGFDPAQISDVYSRVVASSMFEAPLTFDFLARPVALKPQTTSALPEVSADFRSFTFRIRPGIYFADDPAFKGQKRELVAQDYVYAIKRHYDPRLKSPNLAQFENAQITGLSELRRRVLKDKSPFPYDEEVEGLRAPDRYTLQIKLDQPSPRFAFVMTDSGMVGAVAREVVEAYGDRIMEHPVGTGPYRLAAWRRSSQIVMERNPGFREQYYDAQAPAGDPRSLAIAAKLKGRRLPMIDRIEVSIVEESQPRLLGFLNGEHDWIERLPPELSPPIIPNGQLAPHLVKQGMQLDRIPAIDVTYSYFGMENPVVGGYTPEKVALRRALALGYDVNAEIQQARKGQAVPAQSIVPPMTSGYDPAFKSEMSDYDVPRARALLDLYGYVDKDGDGWREQPDGSPLLIEYSAQPDQASRILQDLWNKTSEDLKVRFVFKIAKWPENLKASRLGKLMMWGVSWSATTPDGSYMMDLLYGPSKGQANHARFDLPALNALFRQQAALPDGPERDTLIAQIKKIGVAYMPYKIAGHRMVADITHPWVIGYRRHPFMRESWRYLDIDTAMQAAARRSR